MEKKKNSPACTSARTWSTQVARLKELMSDVYFEIEGKAKAKAEEVGEGAGIDVLLKTVKSVIKDATKRALK